MREHRMRRFAGALALLLLMALVPVTAVQASDASERARDQIDRIQHSLEQFLQTSEREDAQEQENETASQKVPAGDASDTFRMNEETGYAAVIVDDADLLTSEEQMRVMDTLEETTGFCNAICFTNRDSYTGSEIQFGGRHMEQICRDLDLDEYTAVLFMVDMFNRKIAVCPSKNVYSVINDGISNSITDNVYTYAAKGDYESTIREAFIQIFRVFDGQAIAQPMRFITAALLALFAGLAVSLILVRIKTRRNVARYTEMTDALQVNECDPNISVTLVKTQKVRHVEVSGGGGGGGGGGFSGGGGGGGGGFSGGGGSHSF